MQGRLEVQGPNNTWSTVCDDGFSDVAASTVCRQVRTAGPACWRPAARQGPLQALQVFKTATNQRGCNLSSLPQLGLSSTGFALPFAAYGQGSGQILYDDVVCTGSEATLQQCRRAAPKNVDCEQWSPLHVRTQENCGCGVHVVWLGSTLASSASACRHSRRGRGRGLQQCRPKGVASRCELPAVSH